MTLEMGAQLGPYRIEESIGAGGMGEVYRALDPRLGRDVAVKVLPAGYTADPERLQRFEQEARAAGALNHPNITAVFDFGTHEGAPYVVFELLEGETLRQRLGGTALPVRKALDFGVQIARGLAAAHDRGIVHRDLKPENLFVTRDGLVKILDFGLAKLTAPEGSSSQITHLQTVSFATEPGKLLGTIGYMSPEQVRARPADHRSDIFTFGTILYEMLSGRRAFRGDSAVETMSAILKEDPPELTSTNRNLSPELERIVRHCLEKNPNERFQSARDLAFDIEALSGTSGPHAGPFAGASAARARRLVAPLVAAAILLLGLGAGFVAGRGGLARTVVGGAAAGESGRPVYTRLTFRLGAVRNGRFTSDGRSVVYAAQWGADPVAVHTVTLGSGESRALGFPGSDLLGVSSRDELALSLNTVLAGGFISRGTLARVPMGGEAPRPVLDGVMYAEWSPDGSNLAVVRDKSGRMRLEMPLETVLFETAGWISHPRVSPTGDRFAFIHHPLQADDGGEVAILDPGKPARILTSGWLSIMGLAWSPDGAEIWFSATKSGIARSLWAVSPAGELRELASVPGTLTLHDAARDGALLVSREDARMGLVCRKEGEAADRDLSWLDWSLLRAISSDGETVLFDETAEGGGPTYSVYIRKTDGSPAVRLAQGSSFALSPDAKWALVRKPESTSGLALVPTGTGAARDLPTPGLETHHARFFPDGKRILLIANEKDGPLLAYVLNPETGATQRLAPAGIDIRSLAISPDGSQVALQEIGGPLLICPSDGGPARPVPGFDPHFIAVGWSADGHTVYVRKRGDPRIIVRRVDIQTGRMEEAFDIAPPDVSGVTRPGAIALTPDGKTYAYSYLQTTSDLYLVRGVR